MLEKKNVTEPLNHADQGSVPTFSPDRLPVDDGKKPLSQYILSNDKTEILDNLEKTTDSDKIYHYLDPADSTGGLSPHLQTRLKSCVSPLTSAKSDSNIERPPAWERIDYPFYDFGYSENTQNPESTQNNEALSACFSGNKTTLSSPDEDPGFLEDTGPVPDSETLISPVPASVPFTDKAKNINNTGCDNCASNIVHAGSTMGVDHIDNRVTNGTEIIQESETGFPPDDIEDLIKTRSPKEISGIVKNSASVNKANLSLTQNSDLSDKENLPAGIALQGNTVPNSPIMSQISPKNQEISEPGNLFQTPKNINPENQKTQNDL
ncbi:MAG: hypothetical protein IKW74_07545, partial [Thermoguttaceae bacterium]|nr:hypothetical protein [Thermoguttaceae bacterium]